MKKLDKPYLDAPKKTNTDMKEQLIYGNGITLGEKKNKDNKDKEKMLNE